MNIDDAINHLKELEEILHYYHSVSMKEALELGIEAMKRLQRIRDGNYADPTALLSGETEEGIDDWVR